MNNSTPRVSAREDRGDTMKQREIRIHLLSFVLGAAFAAIAMIVARGLP